MDARTDARYKGEKTASNALDAFNWKGDRLNKSAEAEGRLTGIFDDAAAANTRAQEQAQDEVNRERGGAIATGASAKGIADTITASIRGGRRRMTGDAPSPSRRRRTSLPSIMRRDPRARRMTMGTPTSRTRNCSRTCTSSSRRRRRGDHLQTGGGHSSLTRATTKPRPQRRLPAPAPLRHRSSRPWSSKYRDQRRPSLSLSKS